MMLWKLLLLLTLVPIAELIVLVWLAKATSIWTALLVILLTGALGAVLARMEGLRVLRKIQQELAEGHMPGDSLLDGLLILVAAVLLITPGLITDVFGLLLLLPPTRALARWLVKRWLRRQLQSGRMLFHKSLGFRPIHDQPPPGSPPLEDEEEV